jgi:hypothetical protein
MPYRCPVTEDLPTLLVTQDHVVRRDQLLARGMTAGAIAHRVATGTWRILLREIYLCHPGEPSRRQLLIAAQLLAGEHGAIDDIDACRYYGLTSVGSDSVVRVVVSAQSGIRSRGFVVVRRTLAPIQVEETDRLRYLLLAPAVIAYARRATTYRRVLAVLSDAVQRRMVSFDDLVAAHVQAGRRNAKLTDDALEQISAGVRSAPEGLFQQLARTSLVLPQLRYNCLLRLPCGRHISPDALALDAGLVHETNGRTAHARDDLFEDMQARHDVMTASGLIVMHNSPARLSRRGREALQEFERCYLRYKGRGLPDGVVLVRDVA